MALSQTAKNRSEPIKTLQKSILGPSWKEFFCLKRFSICLIWLCRLNEVNAFFHLRTGATQSFTCRPKDAKKLMLVTWDLEILNSYSKFNSTAPE